MTAKLFLLYHKLSWKNFVLNFCTRGFRAKNAMIIAQGHLVLAIDQLAKINVREGFLYINKPQRATEPFMGMIEMLPGSEMTIYNTFSIHSGCHIILMEGAKLTLGSGYINRNVKIRCFNHIAIGNDVAISENVTIWDSDAHKIVGKEANESMPVSIGNHVWIGTNVTILKGVNIGDDVVIAAGSLVNKDIPSGCLAAGVPAKVIKENVKWK